MRVMAVRAFRCHSFMSLVLRNIFFAVAMKTEFARFRDQHIRETGSMRIVAYLAPARGNRPVDVFFVQLKDMAIYAELLNRQNKHIRPLLMAGRA